MKYYQECKKRKRKKRINGWIKANIYEIREEYRNCCGEKIKCYLYNQIGIKVLVKTIYRVLGEKYRLRKSFKPPKIYGEVPKAKKEREVIQADTVDFGEVYAYTYVDTYTRQALVDLELGLEAEDGYASMTVVKERMKRIKLLQVDGGSEFKGIFNKRVSEIADGLRVSRPYKKNEQSYIESFNRSLRKECLGWRKYKRRELPMMKVLVKEYMKYYNNERVHLGLGLRIPNEVATCRI